MLWGNKLLYGHVSDPFPQCGMGSGPTSLPHTVYTYMHTVTHNYATAHTLPQTTQVYKLLRMQGHNVVAVFTIPDVKGRADPLAEIAEQDNVPVFKFPRWRTKGKPLPQVSVRAGGGGGGGGGDEIHGLLSKFTGDNAAAVLE